MAIIKEFREFFLRHSQVNTGNRKDQETGFGLKYIVDGVSVFNRFLKGDYPSENVFTKLFESITFKLNSEDTAKISEQGLVKVVSDTAAMSRVSTDIDGMSLAVQPHQLPEQALLSEVDVNTDTLMSTATDSTGTLSLYKRAIAGGKFRSLYVFESAPPPVFNLKYTVWVSDQSGDDNTGELNDITKPYKTIGAAVAACSTVGYDVRIAGGTYTETLPLTKQSITLIGSPSVVIYSTNAFLTNLGNNGYFNIDGGLQIYDTSSVDAFLQMNRCNASVIDLNMTVNNIDVNIKGGFVIQTSNYAGLLNIANFSISGYNGNNIVNIDECYINADRLILSVDSAVVSNSYITGREHSYTNVTNLKCACNILLVGRLIDPIYVNADYLTASIIYKTGTSNSVIDVNILALNNQDSYPYNSFFTFLNQEAMQTKSIVVKANVVQCLVRNTNTFINALHSSLASYYASNFSFLCKLLEVTNSAGKPITSNLNMYNKSNIYIDVEKTVLLATYGLFDLAVADLDNNCEFTFKGEHFVHNKFLSISSIYKGYISGKIYCYGITNANFFIIRVYNETLPNESTITFENLCLYDVDYTATDACLLSLQSNNANRVYILDKVKIIGVSDLINTGVCIGGSAGNITNVIFTSNCPSNMMISGGHPTYGTITNLVYPDFDLITNADIR